MSDSNSELHERRRRQITDAARQVIARSGADRARMGDVARTAGVSVGMVQHYFGSRDALIVASFTRFFEDSRAAWRRVIDEQPDPVGKLRALLATTVLTHIPSSELYAMWLELCAASTRNDALRALTADWWDLWLNDFEQIIADGQSRGDFAPVASARDVGIRLVSLQDGLAIHVVHGHYQLDDREMYRHVVVAAANDLGVPVSLLLSPSAQLGVAS